MIDLACRCTKPEMWALYKRGKAGQEVQLGRLILIYEDGVGFVSHYSILPRDKGDRDVVVEETRKIGWESSRDRLLPRRFRSWRLRVSLHIRLTVKLGTFLYIRGASSDCAS